MARFASEAELKAFLGKLDADYAEYAPALWQKGIKTPQQLANFSEPHYLACDIPEGHIDDIKARAGTTGRLDAAFVDERSAPSKRAKTGTAPFIEQSKLLVKQYLFDPLPNPRLPSNGSQVLQGLFNFTGLKVPVTAVFYQQVLAIQGPQQRLVPNDDAASAVVTFTELLQTAPDVPFSSEMDTSLYICNFVSRVWRALKMYSPASLKYALLFNKASQLRSVSSHTIAPKLRPDTMLIAEKCLLMFGEDKHTDLAAAFEDLERKRVDLSGMHYGPLRFLLGYAAAGTAVQWCFLPSHANQPIEVIGSQLDVRSGEDRLSFLLSLVQAYRLLAVMSEAVPPLPGRWPLYSEVVRENSIILMEGMTVFKKIHKFNEYTQKQKTSLAAIQKAYAVAQRAAAVAECNGSSQYLVSCTAPPTVVKKQQYRVRTLPCGYLSHVFSEKDLYALATAVCSAAQMLHTAELVHRDFRLPNVVQIGPQQYMVIDLESVADDTAERLPKNFQHILKTCTAEALDASGCFTALSDMHCIGLLLKEAQVRVTSIQADTFLHKLVAKELNAEAALMYLRNEWAL